MDSRSKSEQRTDVPCTSHRPVAYRSARHFLPRGHSSTPSQLDRRFLGRHQVVGQSFFYPHYLALSSGRTGLSWRQSLLVRVLKAHRCTLSGDLEWQPGRTRLSSTFWSICCDLWIEAKFGCARQLDLDRHEGVLNRFTILDCTASRPTATTVRNLIEETPKGLNA